MGAGRALGARRGRDLSGPPAGRLSGLAPRSFNPERACSRAPPARAVNDDIQGTGAVVTSGFVNGMSERPTGSLQRSGGGVGARAVLCTEPRCRLPRSADPLFQARLRANLPRLHPPTQPIITEYQETSLAEARVVFYGAGSSAVGVADQICTFMRQRAGISHEEARARIFMVDSKVGGWDPVTSSACKGRRAAPGVAWPAYQRCVPS